ncbi:conserved hypothetical protein [Flavobacterium sp. 9AF]|nr:conserved hypothetical protein [Flavobacterium sp. 9AF]
MVIRDSLYSDFEKLDHVILDKLNLVGIDKKEWLDNIISKEEYNDSIKIIYSGMSVNPSADDSICVFIKNRELYKPIKDELIFSQQIKLAKERYNLLYKYKKDSLHNKFNQLNDLFIKYRIESSIEPKKILNDIFYYRDNDDYYLNSLRNNFDREKLKERIDGIDKLYYSFVFLNDSLSFFFYFVVFSFWIFLSSLFLVFYFIRNRKNTLKAI